MSFTTTTIKEFIHKYKWKICFWLIFIPVAVWLAPKQSDYYLDDDIAAFKKSSLMPILIGTWITLCTLFLFLLVRAKSFKQSYLSFLYICLGVAWLLFIFQHLILAGTLFINRQFKRDQLKRTYAVRYFRAADSTEITKDSFIPYDITAKHISLDRKLINKLYRPGILKLNDTLALTFNKGLFGILFLAKSSAEQGP